MDTIGRIGRDSYVYTNFDLKVLFHDKIQRESLRFDPKKDKLITQDVVPVKRIDPATGKFKVVDVKVINYVLTQDGKIEIVFEGEKTQDNKKAINKEGKNSIEKGEKGDENKGKGEKAKTEGLLGNDNVKKNSPMSLDREKAMTYVCSNGETNDGLVTKLTPTESFLHVNFHEQQHLIARNIEAFLNDEKIFLEYIRLFTRFDPATGKVYVAGGRAVTIKGKTIHPRNLSQVPWQSLQVHNYQAPS